MTDVDFVARRVEGTRRGIGATSSFGIIVRRDRVSRRLLQLVDPAQRVRNRHLSRLDDTLADARPAILGSVALPTLSASSILAHKLATIRKASAEQPVDPKHWHDAEALAQITGIVLPERPAHVARAFLCTDVEATRARCERSRDPWIPLAPEPAIFTLLGDVLAPAYGRRLTG